MNLIKPYARMVVRLLFVSCFILLINTIHAQVTVDFTASETEGCGSLQVNFCDNSTSTAGPIISWSWSLGGVTSTNECQGRIFGTPGTYDICLTVTDSEGNSGNLCQTNYITVHELPLPDFDVSSVEGCVPHTVFFFDQSSSNNIITEYVWGVEGTTGVFVTPGGSSPDAETTYTLADEYTISLTVTDENNCTNFISYNNLITTFDASEVSISAVDTFQCLPPFDVTFTNDAIQPNVNYIWDFGNGDTYSGTNPPVITYDNSGSYTVTVIGVNGVTDCRDTLILENYITVGFPTDFSFSPQSGCSGLSVSFTDESPGIADAVTWDFGDGSSVSTDTDPTHIYSTPGLYTVSFTRTVGGCETAIISTSQIEIFELPDVAYNNDNAFGCSLPHNVNFSGVSNSAISWLWDFGDGTTSTLQNPNHVYSEFGEFIVTLTVTNSNGCENTISSTNISLIETQAALSNSVFEGCTPLTVSLGDNSTSVVPINSWSWIIETPSGTVFSSLPNPEVTIVDTGCYDIILEVVNVLGCISRDTFENSICVGIIPDVNFEAIPTVSCVMDSISFIDQSSSFTTAWFWDFGDGENSIEQNPFHEYIDTGFYDITLGAAHYGCYADTTITNYIQVTEPIAKFNVEQNCINTAYVEFFDQSVGADSVFWDFGVDGITTDTSTLLNPTFTFPDTGAYFVQLTAFNFSTDCSHTRQRKIFVHDPLASFNLSPIQGCAPLTVSSLGSSVHAEEFEWSVVGGTISDSLAENPDIIFENPGTYTDIQLIVTDVNGCTDTLIYSEPILVNGIDVDFDIDPGTGCVPFDVTFTDQSSNLFANNIEWNWIFGNQGLGTGETTTFTFENEGQFNVTLNVTDDWGCEGTFKIIDAVHSTNPIADFEADTLACTQAGVEFTNNSTGDSLEYLWDFGDGNFSNEENPVHQYATEGIYSICLTVTDINGCDSMLCKTDYVVIANPIANFTLDNGYGSCPPLIVNFENLSQNATIFEWDFGDGSGLSELEAPPHVYTVPGIYDVTLIAGSTSTCTDTFVIENIIVLDGPLGEFSFEIDSSCAPMAVTFTAQSPEAYTYIWDYGDGSPLDTIFNVSSNTNVYYYETTGTYIPKLGIVDGVGCKRILESPISIFVPELSIDFQATDTVMCDFNNPVTFFNLVNSTDAITSFEWFFEGGTPTTSTQLEPTVSFASPGLYDVMLIVENGYCRDSLIKPNYIRIGDVPDAAFNMSENFGCEPFAVTFTDLTTVVNGTVNTWHWDFGDGSESILPQPTNTFYDSTSFDVTLTVTTDVGCVDSITQVLSMYLQPDVTLSASNQSICIGEPTQLIASITSDTTGVDYYWESSSTLSCTSCLNPVATPLDTTTYTFTAISPEGCITQTDITVNVLPYAIPNIVISNDTLICQTDEAQLFVSGGDNLFAYVWDKSQPGLSCYNGCINPIATPDVSTNYTVTVTNMNGCSSTASVQVDVINQMQEFIGEDRIICEGDTVHLSINTGNNPIWLETNGLNCSQCYEAIASPNETTDYVAQVTTNQGCEIFDSIRVNVLNLDDIDAGNDLTLCRDGSVMLDGSFLADDPNLPTSILWSPSSSLDQPDILNPEAFPINTTTYNLIIESGDCVLRDSVKVEIVDKTDVEVLDATVCAGDTVELQITGSADAYQWYPSESLSNPNIANPLANPEETTTYKLIASLAACEPDTAIGNVFIDELPGAYLSPVFSFFEDQSIELVFENVSGNYIYDWSPAIGLSCTDCENPIATLTETTEYSVTVTDEITGCSKIFNTVVRLTKECGDDLIGVPNVFTPNGDGENDELEIKYSSALIIDEYYFRVFDRWGGLLYESNDINQTWDGTSGGQKLASGVYIFVMEFPCQIDGSKVLKKGDITIVR